MATFKKHRGVFIDVGTVLFVGLVVLLLTLACHPYERGFFCDDESIRYPLLSNTISTLLLCIVSFLAPLTVFGAVEALRLLDSSTPRDSWNSVASALLRSLGEVFGVFVFGSGLNQVTVDVGKYSVGRLRPHFWSVCQPFTAECARPNNYVTQYDCEGPDKAAIEEARLSFPSGHAALAFYAAVYVSVFVQHRLHWRSARLLKHLIQGAVLLLAWFTALSRVSDYMHHPTDVMAGAFIGSLWAFVMTSCVVDLRLDSQLASKDELRSLRPFSHSQSPNPV